MALKTWALIRAGAVAELIAADASVNVQSAFGAVTLVDVTAVVPAPVVGQVAAQAGGVWSFSQAAQAPALPALPPAVVTTFQMKAAMLAAAGSSSGKSQLDDVNTWIATQSALLALTWASAQSVARGGAVMVAAAAHFGWTAAQLDALFTAAAVIVA